MAHTFKYKRKYDKRTFNEKSVNRPIFYKSPYIVELIDERLAYSNVKSSARFNLY